jgi:hypothetical protein
VEAAIAYILAGLRAMAESGAPLPGPAHLTPVDDGEDAVAIDAAAGEPGDDPGA